MAIPHEAEYRPNDEDPEVLRTFTSSRMGGGKNASSGPMKVPCFLSLGFQCTVWPHLARRCAGYRRYPRVPFLPPRSPSRRKVRSYPGHTQYWRLHHHT